MRGEKAEQELSRTVEDEKAQIDDGGRPIRKANPRAGRKLVASACRKR
jgi:hypothetical protein